MRLLERIKLAGFRRLAVTGTHRWTVREASGEVVVTVDEEGLRHLIHLAILSRGHKSKSGPLHVQFLGMISTRDPREGEVAAAPNFHGVGDDVYAGHIWASRPR